MKYKCPNCKAICNIPNSEKPDNYICLQCQAPLSNARPVSESNTSSATVGLIGGAALGASIGGPTGAILGGILGALIGKNSKGEE